MMRIRGFCFSAAAALLLLAGGCGGGGEGDEKAGKSAAGEKQGAVKEVSILTMQLDPPFGDYMRGLFAEFEKSHPGVKVRWIDQPYQGYETKLMTSLMGGKAADIINIATETVPKYAGAGRLAEIDALLPKETFDGYLPTVMDSGCRWEGKTWACPWYMSLEAVFYNTSIFKEAGIDLKEPIQSIDDIPALAKTIKEKTGKFLVFPLYTEAGSLKWYLTAAGVPLVDETGKRAAFNTPRGVEIMTFWTDLYKNGLVPAEALTAMHRRPTELFNSGNLAMMTSGAEFLRNIKSDAPELYKNLMIGPPLHWKDREFALAAVHCLAVNKNAADPKLAAELAAFITNGANQIAFCKQATIFPSVTAALDDPFFSQSDDTPESRVRAICAKSATSAYVMRLPGDTGKLQNVFNDVMEKVALGKMTPAEGLKQAEDQWNEILAK